MKRYEVAIIGGGVIGCAIACFLVRSHPQRRVCVIERDPTYARASSALSASSIRQQFSTALSVQMSQFGFAFFNGISSRLNTEGKRAPIDIGLTERGYLVLAGGDGESNLRADNAMQCSNGASVELLDAAALGNRFPWLNTSGITLAGYGNKGEGWFDGYAVLQAFRRYAIANTVEFLAAEVVNFASSGSRIDAALTDTGSRVSANMFVNAGGPWAADLCRFLGSELPVSPRKRQVFVFDCADTLENLPMIFDPSGVWCRPEGARFLAGKAPEPDNDPPAADLEQIDYQAFDEQIWPHLAHRVPAFERIKISAAWAGYYAYNAFDQNAILGHHPDLDNFILANGFSGHGMQHAPAVARGIAELINTGGYTSLDLAPLSLDRVRAGTPIVERTVY